MFRYLQHLGYEVTCVLNFTDVDDKVKILIEDIILFNALMI